MRKFIINVNGNSYEVEVEEVRDGSPVSAPAAPAPKAAPVAAAPKAAPAAAPAPKAAPAPAAAPAAAGGNTVTAPMPGTILAVNVKAGDAVKKGQVLCILEAMKMENEIMASADGTVVSVSVNVGESVNTGQVLVSY